MWEVPELYTERHNSSRFVKRNKGSFVKDLYVAPKHVSLFTVENKIEKGTIDSPHAFAAYADDIKVDSILQRTKSPSKNTTIIQKQVTPKVINSFSQGFLYDGPKGKKGSAPLNVLTKSLSLNSSINIPFSIAQVPAPFSPENTNTNNNSPGSLVPCSPDACRPDSVPLDVFNVVDETTEVVVEIGKDRQTPFSDIVDGDTTQPTPVVSAESPVRNASTITETPLSAPAITYSNFEAFKPSSAPSIESGPLSALNVDLSGSYNAPISTDASAMVSIQESFNDALALSLAELDEKEPMPGMESPPTVVPSVLSRHQPDSASVSVSINTTVLRGAAHVELGSPVSSYQIHNQMGGWKVNAFGRHQDHNVQRINAAISTINKHIVRKSPQVLVKPTSIKLSEILVTSPVNSNCASPHTSTVFSDIGIGGDDLGMDSIVVPVPTLMDSVITSSTSPSIGTLLHSESQTVFESSGITLDEKNISSVIDSFGEVQLDGESAVGKPSSPSNPYQRSDTVISVTSTDADALDGEFMESLSYVQSGRQQKPARSEISKSLKGGNNKQTGPLLFDGHYSQQNYKVHRRLMGWKLTSLPKRNRIVTMLDKIQEISTSDIVDLSYSNVQLPMTDSVHPQNDHSTVLNRSSDVEEIPTYFTNTIASASINGVASASGVSDMRPKVMANESETLRRIWTANPANQMLRQSQSSPALATGYGHLSQREIESIERNVCRRLDAFSSTPIGKADKIKRIISDARKEVDAQQTDNSLLNLNKPDMTAADKDRQRELLQNYLAKEKQKQAAQSHKPKSMLQVDLLRKRDRMEILSAAQQITSQMIRKHNQSVIHKLDDSFHPHAHVPQSNNSTDVSVAPTLDHYAEAETVSLSSGLTNKHLSAVSRSALWESVARPPPKREVKTMYQNVEALGATIQYGIEEDVDGPLSVRQLDNSSTGGALKVNLTVPDLRNIHPNTDYIYMKGVSSEPYLQKVSRPSTPAASQPTSPKTGRKKSR